MDTEMILKETTMIEVPLLKNIFKLMIPDAGGRVTDQISEFKH